MMNGERGGKLEKINGEFFCLEFKNDIRNYIEFISGAA